MSADMIGEIGNAAVPLLGGIYVTLLGSRVVGYKPGTNIKSDEWHARFGRMFKISGPLLFGIGLFGVMKAVVFPSR